MTYMPTSFFHAKPLQKRTNFWNLALECQPDNPGSNNSVVLNSGHSAFRFTVGVEPDFRENTDDFLDIIQTFDRLLFSWMPCSNYESEGAKPPKTLRFHIANYLEESCNAGWSDCTHKGVHSCVCDKTGLEKAVLEKRASWQLHGFPHTKSPF